MLGAVTVVGLVVLAVLLWLFFRTRSQDILADMMAKRKASSKIVTKADYMEGMERIPVAIALTDDAVYYENEDMQASFELANIDEVEYDSDLATGHTLEPGHRCLRLRSHGRTFEFVFDAATGRQWESLLPTKRMGQPAAGRVAS